jgi:hypothetical protein
VTCVLPVFVPHERSGTACLLLIGSRQGRCRLYAVRGAEPGLAWAVAVAVAVTMDLDLDLDLDLGC